jgi:deoxyribonuclease V
MKAALDVHYEKDRAIAACVVFDEWGDSAPTNLFRRVVPKALKYRPGRFFERELPSLLAVLELADQPFDTVVLDGYVHLRAGAGKGLGTHLHESLPYSPIVIGVAKNPLKIADRFTPIYRGKSMKPLFISAIGCSTSHAARSIAGMHGAYRIPTLLKIADQYAKSSLRPF